MQKTNEKLPEEEKSSFFIGQIKIFEKTLSGYFRLAQTFFVYAKLLSFVPDFFRLSQTNIV